MCGWVGGGNWLRGVWGKKWERKEGECELLRAAETGGVGGCGELVGAKPQKPIGATTRTETATWRWFVVRVTTKDTWSGHV